MLGNWQEFCRFAPVLFIHHQLSWYQLWAHITWPPTPTLSFPHPPSLPPISLFPRPVPNFAHRRHLCAKPSPSSFFFVSPPQGKKCARGSTVCLLDISLTLPFTHLPPSLSPGFSSHPLLPPRYIPPSFPFLPPPPLHFVDAVSPSVIGWNLTR